MPENANSFTTRFNFQTPALWFARARLDATHLELTGRQGLKRYHRSIARRHIVHVGVRLPDGLILWLQDGETLRLTVPKPDLWKQALSASD